MNSDSLVIVLSFIILVGSFCIGLIPTLITASNKIMNLISIVGAGLLVGVCLIIIIPEGMLTLNEAIQKAERKRMQLFSSPEIGKALVTVDAATDLHMPSEDKRAASVSVYLGGSLIFGFLVMLLIDQLFMIIKERYGPHEEEEHEHDHEHEHNTLKEPLISRTD